MTKVELSLLRDMGERIKRADERIASLYSRAERVTRMLNHANARNPKSKASHIEEAVTRIDETIAAEIELVNEYELLRFRFLTAITPLPAKEAEVLRRRYIEMQRFPEIARAMKKSTSLIFQLHRAGLKKILVDCSELQ